MIVIEIRDSEVAAALAGLAARLRDLGPAMRDIGEYMVEATKGRFRLGEAPDGAKWPANTPATLAAFLSRKGGATVRRKGEKSAPASLPMGGKKPLIGESKRLGSEIHYRADSAGVVVGSSLQYAAVQQFGARRGQFGKTRRGAPIPWGDIPARPYLGLSEVDRENLLQIIREHMAAGG